ncbi:VCBS repeat-containing protein [Isosphaeraceae bacterium EP7]
MARFKSSRPSGSARPRVRPSVESLEPWTLLNSGLLGDLGLSTLSQGVAPAVPSGGSVDVAPDPGRLAGRPSIGQNPAQVQANRTFAPAFGSNSPGATANTPVREDFDGDGKSDYAVFVPGTAQWVIHNSSDGSATVFVWGLTGSHDTLMSGDFNGDGRADAVAYDPTTSIWSIRNSADGTATAIVWGIAGSADMPLVADFDGDGKTDIAVYRPSTAQWIVHNSDGTDPTVFTWGIAGSGDLPGPADFDGDGKADFAIYRSSELLWLFKNSADGSVTGTYMLPSLADFGPGIPAPLDANGDGKADPSVFAPNSGGFEGMFETKLTNGSDFFFHNVMGADWSLAIGDYNGDGLEDPANYNPATSRWIAAPFATPTFIPNFVWGQAGSSDYPIIRIGVRVPATSTVGAHLGG